MFYDAHWPHSSVLFLSSKGAKLGLASARISSPESASRFSALKSLTLGMRIDIVDRMFFCQL